MNITVMISCDVMQRSLLDRFNSWYESVSLVVRWVQEVLITCYRTCKH